MRGFKGGFKGDVYVRTDVKFTCVKQKGYDQLMHISEIIPNIRDNNNNNNNFINVSKGVAEEKSSLY